MIKNRTVLWLLFGLMALAQLYIPYSMIKGKERIIKNGELVKMKTQPIDPTDPFRGKYIRLRFMDQVVDKQNLQSTHNYTAIETPTSVYASLALDSLGYHHVVDIHTEKPNQGVYLKTTLTHISGKQLFLDFPFDRFYMEESKAKPAEHLYNKVNRQRDTKPAAAVIYVLDGNAVLQDVEIEGRSIADLVEEVE